MSWGLRSGPNLRQRMARRGFLLGKPPPFSLLTSKDTHKAHEEGLYLALSPRIGEKEALRLLRGDPDLAYYLAMNPAAMRHHRVARAVLVQLEEDSSNSIEPFDPFSLEGRALRGMLSLLPLYPKPLRRRVLELARRHGVRGPHLEPEAAAHP